MMKVIFFLFFFQLNNAQAQTIEVLQRYCLNGKGVVKSESFECTQGHTPLYYYENWKDLPSFKDLSRKKLFALKVSPINEKKVYERLIKKLDGHMISYFEMKDKKGCTVGHQGQKHTIHCGKAIPEDISMLYNKFLDKAKEIEIENYYDEGKAAFEKAGGDPTSIMKKLLESHDEDCG